MDTAHKESVHARKRTKRIARGNHWEYLFLVCTQSQEIQWQVTKGMAVMLVYTTKECNYNSMVILHQHGSYDVTCKPRIKHCYVMTIYNENSYWLREIDTKSTLIGCSAFISLKKKYQWKNKYKMLVCVSICYSVNHLGKYYREIAGKDDCFTSCFYYKHFAWFLSYGWNSKTRFQKASFQINHGLHKISSFASKFI